MDPIEVPEDLTSVEPTVLADLDTQLRARVQELLDGPDDEATAAELDAATELLERISGEVTRRETEAEALRQRKQAARERVDALAPVAGDPDEGEGGDGDGDGADATEGDAATEGADAGVQVTDAAGGDAGDVVVTGEGDAGADAGADAGDLVGAAAGAGAASVAVQRPASGSVAGLRGRSGASGVAVAPSSPDLFLTATAHAPDMKPGHRITRPEELAVSIVKARNSFGHIAQGTRQFLPIATGAKHMGGAELSHDPIENFAVLERLKDAGDPKALVASGAFCTPQTPLYEFFRLAEAQAPVEGALPTVQAPRGGIRFIVPPDLADAAGAVAITDEADIDPDDDSTWKPCIRVECPDLDEEFVTGISQCVTFGNLNYKTFPEQVSAFLDDVSVQFTSRKEVFYLDFIDGKSTAVSGVDTGYGAFRQHFFNLETAAVGYRKRRGMRRGAPLVIMEPDWVPSVIALDMLLDPYEGVSSLTGAEAKILAKYRELGLTPTWYNDSATGRGQKFNTAQTAGAINRFPGVAQSYLHAPGTFVRLDGGSLDLGLVRDSTLNRTNDLQLFMEEWIGMAMLGLEAVRLIDVLCPNGAVPEATSLLVCS